MVDPSSFPESTNTFLKRESDIRKFLVKASSASSPAGLKTRQSIYRHILKFLIEEFGKLSYLNSEHEVVNVKSIHANPERTVAKLTQETNIILPIISINQETTENATERLRYNALVMHETRFNTETQRAERIVSLPPRAIDVVYGINIWSKYKADIDQLAEQVRSIFHPAMPIHTIFSKRTKAFLMGEQNQSSFEVADREERLLRKQFIITVEAYIPSPRFLVTSSGKIEELHFETDFDEDLFIKTK